MSGALNLITRKHRQLLVHSYLYYKLGESIIPDATFDDWRRELVDLHSKHPEIARQAPYYSICTTFVDSPSGFSIKEYPEEIVRVAVSLLYTGSDEPYEEFLGRYGLRIIN